MKSLFLFFFFNFILGVVRRGILSGVCGPGVSVFGSPPVSQYTMQVSSMFMVNFILRPSKANTSRLKNASLLAVEMSLNSALTQGKLQRCQTRRSDREIIAETMLTCDL